MSLLAKIPRRPTRRELWEGFCDDAEFLRRHRVTPGELEALKTVALLGEVRTRRDFVFVLNHVRRRFKG